MKKNGSALIAVVIVMTVTFFIAAIVVDRSLKSSRRIHETINDRKAYYYAESLIYDMVNYIDISYIKTGKYFDAVKNTVVTIGSKPAGFSGISDSSITSYRVILISDVARSNAAATVQYTYNIESEVTYMKRKYKVIVKIQTEYTNDNASFNRHNILEKRAFKL
jgi:hypothetical protein